MTGFSAVNHVGSTVSNLDKAIEFYETLTGKEISNKDQIGDNLSAQTQGQDDTLSKYANLHLDNIRIDILEYVEPKSRQANYSNEQSSAMHLCVEV